MEAERESQSFGLLPLVVGLLIAVGALLGLCISLLSH